MRLDDFNVTRIKMANVLLWLMSLYLQYLVQVKIKFRLKCFNPPQNSENKPRGLYFSKALFEGLFLEGLIFQGAKKIIFTACHSGKLKLVLTSHDVISTSPKNFLFFCYSNSSENITCPSGKLNTEFTSPIAKSTSPRLSDTTFFARCIRSGLSTEGNLPFKIDWASLIVGSKFTFFAVFYFVFEGNFPSTGPYGAFIWRGDLTERFFNVTSLGGLYMMFFFTWGIADMVRIVVIQETKWSIVNCQAQNTHIVCV